MCIKKYIHIGFIFLPFVFAYKMIHNVSQLLVSKLLDGTQMLLIFLLPLVLTPRTKWQPSPLTLLFPERLRA